MPDFEWKFSEIWPELYELAEKPLPEILIVHINGEVFSNAWRTDHGESYLMALSRDLEEKLIAGTIFPEPRYYAIDNTNDDLDSKIHLFAVDFVKNDPQSSRRTTRLFCL